MATYKIIQDIEAEDKFVGPLTLKQFIFASITVVCLYICFIMITKHIWPGIFVFLPPAIVSGFLGFPWRRDQSTETWLIAKLRFMFKPRRRIWDQSGMSQLVTITAPKKVEKNLTNQLNPNEVQSRLKALANTIDSRGWVIKNIGADIYSQPNFATANESDRLVDVSVLPQAVPTLDPNAANDMLDVDNNPVAQHLKTMIDQSAQNYRQELVAKMQIDAPAAQAATPAGPAMPEPTRPFANIDPLPAAAPMVIGHQTSAGVGAPSSSDEAAFLQRVHQRDSGPSSTSHMASLHPFSGLSTPPAAKASTPNPAAQTAVTTPVDPAILGLAKNDDLNVATIARQAQRETEKGEKSLGDDEVVISLH